MNLFGILKKKPRKKSRTKDIRPGARKQLNMRVNPRLIEYIRLIAVELSQSRDTVGAHCLEVGIYYLKRSLKNEKLANKIRQHLIEVHQLGRGTYDDEQILRIGEGGNIAQLLAKIEPVLKSWRAFQRGMVMTQKTGSLTYIEKYEKQLLRSVVEFAMWLEQNHVDEPGSPETEGDRR